MIARARILLGLTVLITGCVSSGPKPAGHLSIDYPQEYFTGSKLVEKPAKKRVPGELPWDIGPERWEIALAHPPRTSMRLTRPRYDYPTSSDIFITPLHDRTGWWFAKSYPGLAGNAKSLRKFLASDDPRALLGSGFRIPDEPWNDAGMALRAKFRLIETPTVRGFRVLCYYRQGAAGYGATNAELIYNFQGLTRDGRNYVSARIAVRNPRLPDSMDDPRAKSDETPAENAAERKRVNSWSDDSFLPPLEALDEMMGSISVK